MKNVLKPLLVIAVVILVLVPLGIGIWSQVVPSFDLQKFWTDIGGAQTVITVAIVITVVLLLVFVKDFQKLGLKFISIAVVIAAIAFWVGPDNFTAWGKNIGDSIRQLTGGSESMNDFRTVTTGFVKLQKEATDTFYVAATGTARVKVRNYEGYCVNNSRPEVVRMTSTRDRRIYFLVSKTGKPELVTITSKPGSTCESVVEYEE